MNTSKAQRLAIAGLVAPDVRTLPHRHLRVVNTAGDTVGTLTLVDGVLAVFDRAKIELAVVDDVARLHCKSCGKDLGGVRKRIGTTGLCRPCSCRATIAARTGAEWSQIATRREAKRTPEQRSESTRKAQASKTPAERSRAARIASAAAGRKGNTVRRFR